MYLPSSLLVSTSSFNNETKEMNQKALAREWMRNKYVLKILLVSKITLYTTK